MSTVHFNHIGLSVPDISAAVTWYTTIFPALRLLRPILHVQRPHFPGAPIFRVFDGSLHDFKLAWLGSGPGHAVGLELFEFVEPCCKPAEGGPELDYARRGVFHFAMTVEDPEKICAHVIEQGGCKMGETVAMPGGQTVVYVRDPWGNAIELVTTGFEEMVMNGGGEKHKQ